MQKRKTQLRKIVMEILRHREEVKYECNQFALLRLGVQEVLIRKKEHNSEQPLAEVSGKLSDEDDELLLEIFWDLFLDKTITLGHDSSKPGFPFFKLHSDYKKK